jgi:hypothetical protein
MILFGFPAVGAALFAAARLRAPATSTMPPADDKRQPAYRETELIRRYYSRARF